MDEKKDLNNIFEKRENLNNNENHNQNLNSSYNAYSNQTNNDMNYQRENVNNYSYNNYDVQNPNFNSNDQNTGINYNGEQNQYYNYNNSNENYNQNLNSSYDAYSNQTNNDMNYQRENVNNDGYDNYNAQNLNFNSNDQNTGINYNGEQNQYYNYNNSNENYNQNLNSSYDAYSNQTNNDMNYQRENVNNDGYDNYNAQNPNFNSSNKKNGKKGIITIIGILVAIVGYYVLTNYVFVKKLNISDYYAISIDGSSGDAKAKILSKEAKHNLEFKNFLDKANIAFKLSKSEDIQNGDTIQVDVDYDINLAKRNKIKVINDKFEIKVNDLPTNVKDISRIKNLSQIKELYENYFLSELEKKTDYYQTSYEILGMYSGIDSEGKTVLRIYSKLKTRNMYYDGKASNYYYLELSDLMQNNTEEIIQATKGSIVSDSYLNGELNPQELDSRLKLQGFSKIN